MKAMCPLLQVDASTDAVGMDERQGKEAGWTALAVSWKRCDEDGMGSMMNWQ